MNTHEINIYAHILIIYNSLYQPAGSDFLLSFSRLTAVKVSSQMSIYRCIKLKRTAQLNFKL
jgi:hypothetical protein